MTTVVELRNSLSNRSRRLAGFGRLAGRTRRRTCKVDAVCDNDWFAEESAAFRCNSGREDYWLDMLVPLAQQFEIRGGTEDPEDCLAFADLIEDRGEERERWVL